MEKKSLKEITFSSYRLRKKATSKQGDDAKLNDAIVIVIVVRRRFGSVVVPSTPHVFRYFSRDFFFFFHAAAFSFRCYYRILKNFPSKNFAEDALQANGKK